MLLQTFQVQLHRGQQSLDGVLCCQLKAKITQGLRRSQGFQLLSEAGETPQHPQLAHPGQTAASSHLEFQQSERCCSGQTAFGSACSWNGEAADAFGIA